MPIYALGEQTPEIHPDAYVHPDAVIIGSVVIGAHSSVWPTAVLRGDDGFIYVGERSSIQDGTIVHTTPFRPTTIGNECTIGHNAHLEGCRIEDKALVGSGAIVLHEVVVGREALVGAGAFVPNRKVIPPLARALGIEWNIGPTDGADAEFFSSTGPNPPDYMHPGNSNTNALGAENNTGIANPANRLTYGISRNWGFVEAQLQSLEENRKANIISNPRITTVDNREAKIVVGQKIPLIVQDVAGNPVSQLQTIGIQLKVTPHLTQDKKIIMDLHPEVSDLSTQSTVQGGIIINTSEADTRVMVDDGQTAVIGGLIRTNESTVHRGVPVLKDIPLVGLLFSEQSKVRQNRELIIFVTPRLVESVATR